MNAHALAHAAYGQANTAQKHPRAAEYDVISRITARLRRAVDARPENFVHLVEAMTENRRLWTELAIDLASPGNGLPAPLRVQLLQLAQFTLSHSEDVVAGRADAAVLIDINLAVLRGLARPEKGDPA